MATEQDLRAIAASDWPGLRFSLHPSVQILNFEWDIPTAWRAIDSDAFTAFKHAGKLDVICWRKNMIPQFETLTKSAAQALSSIRKGSSFADVCALLTAYTPSEDTALEVALMVKRWLGMELIRDLA